MLVSVSLNTRDKMPSKTASTAAASSATKQTRLRRLRNQINPLFRRPFNYFHEQIMSSKSTSAAVNEYFIYMGHGTVPKNVTHVIVHESVTVIPRDAFRFCCDLKEVILPEGLLEIGKQAFESCTSLVNINFPSTLRVIGRCAFYGCYSGSLDFSFSISFCWFLSIFCCSST